jgi:hypothetical protein
MNLLEHPGWQLAMILSYSGHAIEEPRLKKQVQGEKKEVFLLLL